jgi:hypothetical protein
MRSRSGCSHRSRVGKEEEGDEARDRGECSVLERHRLRLGLDDVRSSTDGRARYSHHVAAVVEPRAGAPTLERAPEEDATAAANVQQPVVWLECQRREHRLPEKDRASSAP